MCIFQQNYETWKQIRNTGLYAKTYTRQNRAGCQLSPLLFSIILKIIGRIIRLNFLKKVCNLKRNIKTILTLDMPMYRHDFVCRKCTCVSSKQTIRTNIQVGQGCRIQDKITKKQLCFSAQADDQKRKKIIIIRRKLVISYPKGKKN